MDGGDGLGFNLFWGNGVVGEETLLRWDSIGCDDALMCGEWISAKLAPTVRPLACPIQGWKTTSYGPHCRA